MNKQGMYLLLAVVFGIAGLVWIVGGLLSVYHRILYPLIGVMNLGIAYYCKTEGKQS